MTHFIELNQFFRRNLNGKLIKEERVVSVAVEHIEFYCDNHIVFNTGAIDVYESYDEIKQKIDEALRK